MEVDIVSEDVISVPLVGIIRVEEWVSQDVAVLRVLEAVELVHQNSLLSLRCLGVIKDNFHHNLLDVYYLISTAALNVLHDEVNLDFNISLLQGLALVAVSSFKSHADVSEIRPHEFRVLKCQFQTRL
jgi:hypothetical protein